MRRESKIALMLGAATLAGVGLAAWSARDAAPVLGTADAIAIRDLELRPRPERVGPFVAFIAAGSPVRIEATAAPGWVYVYQRLGSDVVLEGYAPATDVAPPTGTGQVRPGLLLDPSIPLAPSTAPPSSADRVFTSPGITPSGSVDVLRRPAPRLSLPWMTAPISFLTGEATGSPAVALLVAEAEDARRVLDVAFRRATNGPPLTAVSTYRSFADQARIVALFLRANGVPPNATADAIRQGLLRSLETRSVPGFSRHHWGSEVDVLTTDSGAWRPGGRAEPFAAAIAELAPNHGLYNPYAPNAFPEPGRPHYNAEPWHLSLIGPGEALRQRWLREIGDDPVQLASLLDRAAAAIAQGGFDPRAVREALGTIDLVSYVRNVAPAPTETVNA